MQSENKVVRNLELGWAMDGLVWYDDFGFEFLVIGIVRENMSKRSLAIILI